MTTPTTYHHESELLPRVLARLSALGCLAWVNRTGKGRALYDPKVVIAFGLRGSSDILAIVPPTGRFLGVEVKTENDTQSAEQRKFQRAVERVGGLYRICRHPDEVAAFVREAQRGEM